jgi:hypothetical protein
VNIVSSVSLRPIFTQCQIKFGCGGLLRHKPRDSKETVSACIKVSNSLITIVAFQIQFKLMCTDFLGRPSSKSNVSIWTVQLCRWNPTRLAVRMESSDFLFRNKREFLAFGRMHDSQLDCRTRGIVRMALGSESILSAFGQSLLYQVKSALF